MDYAGFSDEMLAHRYRMEHGGWIFIVEGAKEWIWFSLAFTPTPIFTHHATRGLSGKLI